MMYVASTLTSDVKFEWHDKPAAGAVPRVVHSVFVRGGANRADKRLETPPAVSTMVSDEDYARLLGHDLFQKYLKNGFIAVSSHREDAEVMAGAMARGDKSRQLVPEDESVRITDNRGQLHVPSAGRPVMA